MHILNAFSKLYFVTDLEEQSLSHANMPRHKSGGYKLRKKREKKTRLLRARDVPRGWGDLPGWGQFTRHITNYSPFSPPDREPLHHTLTMIGGGGSEKASFQLSFLPVHRLPESCIRSNGI